MEKVLLLWGTGMTVLVGYLLWLLYDLRRTMDVQQELIDAYRQRDASEGRITTVREWAEAPLSWTSRKGSGR